MCIYILFDHHFFHIKNVQKDIEIKKIFERMMNSGVLGELRSPCWYFSSQNIDSERREELSINVFDDIFEDLKIKIRHQNFLFYQIESLLRLKNETGDFNYPIQIQIWKNNHSYGDISISGIDNKFNNFFLGSEKWQMDNRKILNKLLKVIPKQKLGKKSNLINKINVGFNAFPFDNVKSCFYIWRNKVEDAYRDIMKFRAQLRKDRNKLLEEATSLEEKQELSELLDEMLTPFEEFYLPRERIDGLTINLILKHTHIMDEYLDKSAKISRGSYILETDVGVSNTLFENLVDFHRKFNHIYKNRIPTQAEIDKKVQEGFLEEFKVDTSDFFQKRKEYLPKFKQLRGILPKSAYENYLKEKEKDRLIEESKAPLKDKKK